MPDAARYSAVVLRPDRYWMVDQDGHVGTHETRVPVDNLADVLERASTLFDRDSGGTLLVDAPLLRAYQQQAKELRGWRVPRAGILPWTTLSHPHRPTVHLGILPEIDQGRTPLFDLGQPRDEIVRALGWYHSHMGVPWRMSAGVAGCAALRAQYPDERKGRQPFWGARQRASIGDGARGAAGDLLWQRPPTAEERELPFVHAYDLNAARLGAANTAELPWSRLERVEGYQWAELDAQAGYWLVDVSRTTAETFRVGGVAAAAGPLWINPVRIYKRQVWLTAPVMRELSRRGVHLPVIEAYVSDAKRWALSWAKQVNAARLYAARNCGRDSPEFASIQATFRQTVGLIASEGGSIYLPVVAHTIIDQQRMTVLGTVERIWRDHKRLPLRIHTDCLWYASAGDWEELPVKQDPIALGHFKPKGTWTMAEWSEMTDAKTGIRS